MVSNAKIKERNVKKDHLSLNLQDEKEKHESHLPRTIDTILHYGDQQSI